MTGHQSAWFQCTVVDEFEHYRRCVQWAHVLYFEEWKFDPERCTSVYPIRGETFVIEGSYESWLTYLQDQLAIIPQPSS